MKTCTSCSPVGAAVVGVTGDPVTGELVGPVAGPVETNDVKSSFGVKTNKNQIPTPTSPRAKIDIKMAEITFTFLFITKSINQQNMNPNRAMCQSQRSL